MADIQYGESITPEEYNELRVSVNWDKLSEGQAKRGLENTTFIITASINNEIVGMARTLFDFGYTAYIGDVIVRPEYHGLGIGKEMVTKLMNQVLDTAEKGDKIMFMLGSAKGKEDFYRKLGFDERPSDIYGPGMTKKVVVK